MNVFWWLREKPMSTPDQTRDGSSPKVKQKRKPLSGATIREICLIAFLAGFFLHLGTSIGYTVADFIKIFLGIALG